MIGGMIKRIGLEGLLYCSNYIVTRIPSHTFRKAFYRRLMKIQIGPRSYIFMGAHFETRGNMTLGEESVINERCRLDARGGLTIGSHVSISPDTHILTADHDIRDKHFTGRHRPVVIEDYAFIGSRATILPGVTVGRGGVVAAGSVVTRSVEPYAIVAGIPAKKIGDRPKDLEYPIHYDRLFH